MFDFRYKVFYLVAKRLNFTKAAEELFISQPAVSKHIQEIETHFKTKLFDRSGNKIKLTAAGDMLLGQVQKLVDIHRDIERDFDALSDMSFSQLRIGASTTVAQYYLPKHIAAFKKLYPGMEITMIANNTEAIEDLLIEGKIDLGIVEGQSKRRNISYTCLVKDEIVLCTRTGNQTVNKPIIEIGELVQLPMIFREVGSGSLEVVATGLKNNGINLSGFDKVIELQNTESIKTYLLNSDTFAFLSIYSIHKELRDNEIKIIDISNITFERCFYGILNQGDKARLPELFFRYLHNQKL